MSKKLTKKQQKKASAQYLNSLKRSLERVDGRSFEFYSVKITDHKLLKFLLGKAFIEKSYITNMVEELIIKGLASDKSYQDYSQNNLTIKIEIQPTLRFYSHTWAANQKAQQRGQE